MSTQSEVLALLGRLDRALAVRAKLLEQRSAMIRAYRETGQRSDEWEFSSLSRSLHINEQTIRGLQATLKALGVARGDQ